nr:integrator complex subunit 11-like [Parasteatoda tepidariorum]
MSFQNRVPDHRDRRKNTARNMGTTWTSSTESSKGSYSLVDPTKLKLTKVVDDLEITACYAGHVLGFAMFLIKVGSQSVVYTGDFNTTPDRHLGPAWIDKCRPDLLITDSTEGTTIRDSKWYRERDFLTKVHDCVEKGGKA